MEAVHKNEPPLVERLYDMAEAVLHKDPDKNTKLAELLNEAAYEIEKLEKELMYWRKKDAEEAEADPSMWLQKHYNS